MRNFKIAVVVSSILLGVSSTAYADKNQSNQHFMSKRPYHEMPAAEAYNAEDKWEGATLVNKEIADEAGANGAGVEKQPHLRLHSLGKRPFIEKSDVQ